MRKGKAGVGPAKEEVFAVARRRETLSLTWGKAVEPKRENRALGEAHGFIFFICSHDS